MSLRTRLIAATVVLAALPTVVATSIVIGSVPHMTDDRTRDQVAAGQRATMLTLQLACVRASAAATQVAQAAASPAAALSAGIGGPITAVLLLDSSGTPVAAQQSGGAPVLDADGVVPLAHGALAPYLSAPDCRGNGVGSGVGGGLGGPQVVAARASLDVRNARTGRPESVVAVAGSSLAPTDTAPGLLAGIPVANRVRVALEAGAADQGTGFRHRGGRTSGAIPLLGGAAVVVSAANASHAALYTALIVTGIALVALAALISWLFTRRLGRRNPDGAFEALEAELAHVRTELAGSQDELRRSLQRLGAALSGTHDLDRILQVILDTAMGSTRATAGALLLTSAARDALYLEVSRGLAGRVDGKLTDVRVSAAWTSGPNGQMDPGVLARVASTGEVVHGVVGSGTALAPDEPRAASVLAVPLRSGGRITGVLGLYDRRDAAAFDERDVAVAKDFLAEATLAIDNVLMHREAERLSVTDGLTGLWNYRYASIALEREVERAQRFGHPLALIMLDLDRFKQVNDVYGHQRGDAVLVDVAGRLRSVIREVDILARYGGEEMLLILPETDVGGAKLLADRVLAAMRSRPVGGAGEVPVPMTASLGISVMPAHGTSARTLIAAADTALYVAKGAGRDTARIARLRQVVPEGAPEPDDAAS